MKKCPTCNVIKNDSEFYRKKDSDLLHSYCKKCSVERIKGYYRENRTKILSKVAKEYSKNRESKREKYRKWSWRIKIETLEKYGNKCACCGESQPMFLAIDHKDNDGNKHRKTIGNIKIYTWLKKNNYPSNFQILCHNCNMAKAFWKTCPHQARR